MEIIDSKIELEDEIDGKKILKKLEKIGRTCYKSENKITENSAENFIRNIIKSGHESVLEHEQISVRIYCDRGVSHEIVRHRIGSYAQESTRYCDYSKEKFDNQLTFINPHFQNDKQYNVWKNTLEDIEKAYLKMIEFGVTPEYARAILPLSLKTEIVVTYNLREWRHFIKTRISKQAHPHIREIAYMVLKKFKEKMPLIFDDIEDKL